MLSDLCNFYFFVCDIIVERFMLKRKRILGVQIVGGKAKSWGEAMFDI